LSAIAANAKPKIDEADLAVESQDAAAASSRRIIGRRYGL
jgi:hypothetical protein